MEAIKETILKLIGSWQKQINLEGGESPDEILKKAVSQDEWPHVQFNSFKNGIFGIIVDSSSWLYTLNLKKQSLVEKLCQLSNWPIKDLRFKIGEIEDKHGK